MSSAILIQSIHTKLCKKGGIWKRWSLAFQMTEKREHNPRRHDWIQFLGCCWSPVLWKYHVEGDDDRDLFIKIGKEEGFPPYWNGLGHVLTQGQSSNKSWLWFPASINCKVEYSILSLDSASLESNYPSMFCNSVMNWSSNSPHIKVGVSIYLDYKVCFSYCCLCLTLQTSKKPEGTGKRGLIQYLLYLRREACKRMIY